ncbi:MAG: hypothetical protein NT003_01285, partial [Candidatus Magasanikbacteria bacterium]|nr:hypothetical protein [Candidatus Magasanikbacteria bacterium]
RKGLERERAAELGDDDCGAEQGGESDQKEQIPHENLRLDGKVGVELKKTIAPNHYSVNP